jgi:hypothetical protein
MDTASSVPGGESSAVARGMPHHAVGRDPGPCCSDSSPAPPKNHGLHRQPTQGIRESYEKGYDSLNGPPLDVKRGGQTVGLFREVEPLTAFSMLSKCTNNDPSLDSLVRDALLGDPGQMHLISTSSLNSTCSFVNENWEGLTGESWRKASGGNLRAEYDAARRLENTEYDRALESLSAFTRKTCDASKYIAYLRELSQHERLIQTELRTWKRRAIAFKVRIMRQRALSLLANHFTKKGEIFFFGTGSCRGKGHPRVPTKALIRAIARVMPVITLWEWGTSSRCPHCRSGKKMKSERGWDPGWARARKEQAVQSECTNNTDTLESSGAHVVTYKRSTCGSVKDTSESMFNFISAEQRTDDRVELCQECRIAWSHDEVSLINFAHIVWAQILGFPRPLYLCPKSRTQK